MAILVQLVMDLIIQWKYMGQSAVWVINSSMVKNRDWYHILGEASEKHPYRSKISGLLDGINIINQICKVYKVMADHVTISQC